MILKDFLFVVQNDSGNNGCSKATVWWSRKWLAFGHLLSYYCSRDHHVSSSSQSYSHHSTAQLFYSSNAQQYFVEQPGCQLDYKVASTMTGMLSEVKNDTEAQLMVGVMNLMSGEGKHAASSIASSALAVSRNRTIPSSNLPWIPSVFSRVQRNDLVSG